MDPPFLVNRDEKQKKDDDETHNSQEEGERRMYRGIKVNDPGNLSAPPLQTVATQILFILRLPTPFSQPFYQHRERITH